MTYEHCLQPFYVLDSLKYSKPKLQLFLNEHLVIIFWVFKPLHICIEKNCVISRIGYGIPWLISAREKNDLKERLSAVSMFSVCSVQNFRTFLLHLSAENAPCMHPTLGKQLWAIASLKVLLVQKEAVKLPQKKTPEWASTSVNITNNWWKAKVQRKDKISRP